MGRFVFLIVLGFSLAAKAENDAVPPHLLPVIEDVGLTPEQIKEKNDLVRAISLNEENIDTMKNRVKEYEADRGINPNAERRIKELQEEIAFVQKGVAGFKKTLGSIQSKLEAGTLAKAKNELAQIAKLKLDGKIGDQRFEVLELSLQLNALERALDSSVAAEYARTKLARLLSSQKAFCPSVSACQGGKAVGFEAANDLLNDVFYNDSGTLGRERGTGKQKKSPTHGSAMGTF